MALRCALCPTTGGLKAIRNDKEGLQLYSQSRATNLWKQPSKRFLVPSALSLGREIEIVYVCDFCTHAEHNETQLRQDNVDFKRDLRFDSELRLVDVSDVCRCSLPIQGRTCRISTLSSTPLVSTRALPPLSTAIQPHDWCLHLLRSSNVLITRYIRQCIERCAHYVVL